jgi:hypothetical protein
MQVVLNLGPKRAAALSLPRGLERPEVDAEYVDDERTTIVSVHFEQGQLHLEVTDDRLEFHYHRANGDETEVSPFSPAQTEPLLAWAKVFAEDVHALMPGLLDDASEAAAWHDAGYTIYVCETDPAQLDLLEVRIEGEILVLPWLGAGTVDQDHDEGDNHPIVLLWSATESSEPRAIARAWLDPRTGEPASAGLPGVDWTEVGLPENEALAWLEDVYLNHHVIEDPAMSILFAALERVGGLDKRE